MSGYCLGYAWCLDAWIARWWVWGCQMHVRHCTLLVGKALKVACNLASESMTNLLLRRIADADLQTHLFAGTRSCCLTNRAACGMTSPPVKTRAARFMRWQAMGLMH